MKQGCFTFDVILAAKLGRIGDKHKIPLKIIYLVDLSRCGA